MNNQTRAVNASGLDFATELRNLERSMHESYPDLEWDSVRIYEERFARGIDSQWRTDAPTTGAQEFAPRFQEILDEVDRSWVNISGETIHGSTLIVSISWFPPEVEGDPDLFLPPDGVKKVHVNHSGFSHGTLEGLRASRLIR